MRHQIHLRLVVVKRVFVVVFDSGVGPWTDLSRLCLTTAAGGKVIRLAAVLRLLLATGRRKSLRHSLELFDWRGLRLGILDDRLEF